MKKLLLLLFLLASSFSVFSQTVYIDSTGSNNQKNQYLVGFDPSYNSTIDGITLNYWISKSNITSNGMYLDVNPMSLLFGVVEPAFWLFMLPEMMFPDKKDSLISKLDTVIIKNKVNGISISTGGLRLNKTIINGISFSFFLNMNSEVNGVGLGFGLNGATYLNGFLLSSVNVSQHGRGLMVGLFNLSNDFKGVQIGLWNRIGDWGLPFINIRF